MHQILILSLFIAYYLYTIYVFYKLSLNLCSCKKLENFKQMWQFKYVKYVTPVLLLANLYALYKFFMYQHGGNNIYNQVIIFLSLGYALTFVNDYAIISLFSIMKNQNCPCQVDHRLILNNLTYGKLIINVIFYILTLMKTDKKLINKIIKKHKLKQKK